MTGANGRLGAGVGVWKEGDNVRKLEYMRTKAGNLTPGKVNVYFHLMNTYHVLKLH